MAVRRLRCHHCRHVVPLRPRLDPFRVAVSGSMFYSRTKANFQFVAEVMASPKKKCSKDLHKHNHHSRSKMTSANACGKASQKCFLKVHGIGDAPFLMELVAYDTIKTVRSLLGNVLKNEFIKHNSTSLPASNHNEFKLFTGFPRRLLNDDSKSLGDLGLVPNGVLHLVRTTIFL